MQKIIYAAIAICCLTACKNNTSNQVAPTPTQASAPVKEKKTITKMPSAEVSKKFGIDVVEKLTYSGYYEAISNGQNQEILDGSFALTSDKQQLKPEEEEMFTVAEYKGAYSNGIKDGTFDMEAGFYEAGERAAITFDKGQCVEGSYEAQELGYCSKFKGKLTNCTFAEVAKKAKEVECE